MKTHGASQFGQMVDKNMAQSHFLEGPVKDSPNLELLGSGPLPIVNFRYRGSRRLSEKGLNRLNESLVSEIQKRRHRHPVALRHRRIRRCGTTMMLGTGQELLKRSPDE